MGVFSRSFTLWKACWRVLTFDKELVLFPIISGIVTIAVTATFLLPLATLFGFIGVKGPGEGVGGDILPYVLLFVWYFVTSFIAFFFNSALIGCAFIRLDGKNPTLADGFRIAFQNLGRIAGWALVSATVGVLLNLLERIRIGGENGIGVGIILRKILGFTWSVLTFLVLPVLIIEQIGPIEAVKRSGYLLKKTWGEQIVGTVGFGLVTFLLSLLGFIPLIVGIIMGTPASIAIGVGLFFVYIIALFILTYTLHSIFTAVLYRYAVTGEVPAYIPETFIQRAFKVK